MDENGTAPVNERNFALPLCLLSLVFFGLYFIIFLWIFVLVLQILLGSVVPSFIMNILAGLALILPGGLLFISLIGTIFFIREMKVQSLPWKAGTPLCTLFGVIIVFSALYLSPWSGTIQIYLGMISLAGFMSLPYGVAYLLRDFRGTGFDALQTLSSLTGKSGLIISAVLFFLTLIISSLLVTGLEAVFFTVIIFGIFHILVLMPLVGVKILRLGISCSKTPPGAVEASGAAELIPRKKPVDILKADPRSISPRVKWTIVIAIALILIIAVWYVYSDITDTTPGRKWTQTTPEAPFGDKEAFASAEYKGKFWLIGGTRNSGPYGEAWYTSDGNTWTRESSADMVPRHLGATAVVLKDALWIIGGADEKTQTHGNDIWFSGNGITWSEMQPKSVFPPRAWHSTVVFRDRIWVIGGRDNTGYRNDVWSSDDGISWVQAKPAAEFSPRSDQASFVYKDKIWMIGGRDRTGDLTDVWNSDDGSNWTQVAVPAAFERGNPVSAVTFDGRIWVIQIPHTWGIASPWATARPSGIWYSYDGIAWTKVDSSPEFFSDKYSGGEPFLIVFQNRLYVLQRYNRYTGIWYTMPQGQVS